MRQAIQYICILLSFIAFLAVACGAWGTGQAINAIAPAEPTLAPTPSSDSAAVVRETLSGLNDLGLGDAVRSGADANNANTAAVHTSDWGQFVQDTAPLLPLLIILILAACVVIIALAVLWFLVRSGDSRDLGQLVTALTRLEALFKSAGAEVESSSPVDNS